MSILVVEDDASIRETLGMVLEAYNYEAVLLDTGDKVMAYLRKEWPDLMLLDLNLQDTSGEEVYANIMAEFGRVPPTIVLSAVQSGALSIQKMAGAIFMSKPYGIEQLLEVIEKSIKTRGAA
jgi:DNA-binding response OmpR family regulator